MADVTIPDMTLAKDVEVPNQMKTLGEVASTARNMQAFKKEQGDLQEQTAFRDLIQNNPNIYNADGTFNADKASPLIMKVAPTTGGALLSQMIGNQKEQRATTEQTKVANALSDPDVVASISHPKMIQNPADTTQMIPNPHPMAGQVDNAKLGALLTQIAPTTGQDIFNKYIGAQKAQTEAQKSLVEMGAMKRAQVGQLAASLVGRPKSEILATAERFKKENPDLAGVVDFATDHIANFDKQEDIDKQLQVFSNSTQEVSTQIAQSQPRPVTVDNGRVVKQVDINRNSPGFGKPIQGTQVDKLLPVGTPYVDDKGQPRISGSFGDDSGNTEPSQKGESENLTPVQTSQRSQYALDYFKSHGYSDAAAKGLVARIGLESGHDAKVSGDGGDAQGIMQWHADRRANFEKVFGKPFNQSTYEEQLKFIDWELKNSEKSAGAEIMKAKDAKSAGEMVSKLYARPKDTSGEASRTGTAAASINAPRSSVGAVPSVAVGPAPSVAAAREAQQTEFKNHIKRVGEEAASATLNNSLLDEMVVLSKNAKSGTGFDLRAMVHKAAETGAIDPSKASEAQQIMTKVEAQIKASKAGTDAERAVFESSMPGTSMTPGAVQRAAEMIQGQNDLKLHAQKYFTDLSNKMSRGEIDAGEYAKRRAEFESIADPQIFEYKRLPKDVVEKSFKLLPPDQQKALRAKARRLDELGAL